ncbi:MAG: hypothetical protein ACUVS2_17685 [Candidatus Flexifilum sp.]
MANKNPSEAFSFDEPDGSDSSGAGGISFDFSGVERAQPGVYTTQVTFAPGQPPQVSQGFTPLMPDSPVRRARPGCCCWSFVVLLIVFPVGMILLLSGLFNGAIAQLAASLLGEDNVISQIVGAIDDAVPDTRPLPASAPADAFDPVAALPEIRAFAGDGALLAEIYATSVRPDGTLNLNATYTPRPYVDYRFYRVVPRPDNAPPIGAGGTSSGPWFEPITISAYQPGQMSLISRTGGGVNVRTQFINQGLAREIDEPTTSVSFNTDQSLLDPACSFAELWAQALTRGAPAEAVASIHYNASGYDFVISGVISLRFDSRCKPV